MHGLGLEGWNKEVHNDKGVATNKSADMQIIVRCAATRGQIGNGMEGSSYELFCGGVLHMKLLPMAMTHYRDEYMADVAVVLTPFLDTRAVKELHVAQNGRQKKGYQASPGTPQRLR